MFLINRSVLSPPPSRFYYFFKPPTSLCKYKNTRSGLARHVMGTIFLVREYGSTLYVGLARAVSPTNTNFRLTFLLTRLQEALYEDLAV